MKEPITVEMVAKDADGQPVQELKQYQLDYASFVAFQKAVSLALVGLGEAGVEAKKAK
jgi:hypothetical protein